MFQYIAFLKGINVGGKNIVKMSDLTNFLSSNNYYNVKTYIQSGNIIFETKSTERNQIKKDITRLILKEFNIETCTILLTSNELISILEYNPFLNIENYNSKFLYFTFLNESINQNPITDDNKYSPDEFKIDNNCIYVYCPTGYGKTKLTNTFFEKKLKCNATTRNLNTLNSINQLVKK